MIVWLHCDRIDRSKAAASLGNAKNVKKLTAIVVIGYHEIVFFHLPAICGFCNAPAI